MVRVHVPPNTRSRFLGVDCHLGECDSRFNKLVHLKAQKRSCAVQGLPCVQKNSTEVDQLNLGAMD